MTAWVSPHAHAAASEAAPAARRRNGTMTRKNFKTAVFVAATVAKAAEPVLIDWSQQRPGSTAGHGYAYSLASAVACAEAVKCAACWALMLATRDARGKALGPEDLRFEQARPYLVPAAMLAIANQTLFVGITHLGALLNAIARKAVAVLSTALLAQAVLGVRLSHQQQLSLVLLILGFVLLLPHVSSLHDIHPLAVLLSPGLLAALVGGVCTAGQGVYFEKASKGAQTQSVFMQTFLFSFFGFLANAGTMAMAHAAQWMESDGTAPAPGFFDGFDRSTWCAVLGIAVADLTMACFFKYLDASSYNFCRVLATWLQGVVTLTGMLDGITHTVTVHFVIGSILVSVASIMYKAKTPLSIPSLPPGVASPVWWKESPV